MKGYLDRLIEGLFGAEEITLERGQDPRVRQTKPNIIQRLRGLWGDYVPEDRSVESIQPTATPTSTPKPTATPKLAMQEYQGLPRNQGYDYILPISGFRGEQPSENINSLITSASLENEINPALLAALLYQESRFNPMAVGGSDPDDIGIAQINLRAHPDVTREQALDPDFAIRFAAQKLANDIAHFNDINRGLAAYNVGRGGANVRGPETFGGGPLGQRYIDNVARNLERQLIDELGLTVSPSILSDY